MSRHRIRRVLMFGALVLLPPFVLGIAPALQDLVNRVGLLEGTIEAFEAETVQLQQHLASLQAQVDALQASDATPIVVDSDGDVVGTVFNANKDNADVQIDLPGLPLFFLQVRQQEIKVQGVTLWFESEDCTGQAWIDALDVRGVMGTVVAVRGSVPLPPAGRTFYVADPLDSPEMIFRLSWDQNDGFCQPADVGEVSAKRVTPLDLDSLFTPPFRVTTRERMQAQP